NTTSAGVTAPASDGPQCPGAAPADNWFCQNGRWIAAPGTANTAAGQSSNGNTNLTPTTAADIRTPSTSCASLSPGQGFTCQNGVWMLVPISAPAAAPVPVTAPQPDVASPGTVPAAAPPSGTTTASGADCLG